jgi:hypothetical protein
MKRHTFALVAMALLVALAFGPGSVAWGAGGVPPKEKTPSARQAQAENLLANGSMEQGFYWRYPNHYVANEWSRWWIHGTILPEFDDVRPTRPNHYDGDHAQVYFKWGASYTAGIYQVVSGLTPCTPYRFTMWARNHSLESAKPRARIGLDTQGTQLTPSDENSAVKTGLPSSIVWSQEQEALFTWEELSVEAEPAGTSLTAITYASPWRPNDGLTYYFDTFWDAGKLVPFTPDRLADPASWASSSFINKLSVDVVLDRVIVTWNTTDPASSQVWYNVNENSTDLKYEFATPVDLERVKHHKVIIDGLGTGDTVKLVAASRRPANNRCTTAVSAQQKVQTLGPNDRVPAPDSWTPSQAIENFTATLDLDDLIITWDTPGLTSTTQVWYTVLPATVPFTHTGTLSYTVNLYLPLMSVQPSEALFKSATPLDLTPVEHHQAIISDLDDGDSVRFVALSSHIVDEDQIVTEVSELQELLDIDISSTGQSSLHRSR